MAFGGGGECKRRLRHALAGFHVAADARQGSANNNSPLPYGYSERDERCCAGPRRPCRDPGSERHDLRCERGRGVGNTLQMHSPGLRGSVFGRGPSTTTPCLLWAGIVKLFVFILAIPVVCFRMPPTLPTPPSGSAKQASNGAGPAKAPGLSSNHPHKKRSRPPKRSGLYPL